MTRVFPSLLTLIVLGALGPASAQSPETGDGGGEAGRSGIENVNPAVDFSESEPSSSSATPERAGTQTRGAIDTLNLETTSITGNQELPRVLYIVPWKQSDLGDLVGRPVDTLLDEVLAPVDPEVFERHLDYYETLYRESQEDSSQ